ncbi:MAG TPA: arylamine N-acetyltransferase [Vicinamibacteria bacterium]|nr:arylamine N-acetyltransferase [Vicinamibacteria bacterium]
MAPGLDLDAYLGRIGERRPLAPTLEGLVSLHRAHCAAIPFENLDILLGRPIDLDIPALEAKLVRARRGGYCFEQNTLFRAALEGVGFRVVSLAARVRAGATEVRPRTHLLLGVELPEGPFVADVGFGGDGLVHPIPLAAETETWVGPTGHRLRVEGDWRVLQGNATGEWSDLYAFTLEAHHPVDFVMANHFTSTYPRSPFVLNLTAQRSWPERRVVLRNRDLAVREGGAIETSRVRDPEHLLEVLAAHFDLVFPAGTRFRQPEFGPS